MLVFYRENPKGEICAVYFKERQKAFEIWKKKHPNYVIVGRKFA